MSSTSFAKGRRSAVARFLHVCGQPPLAALVARDGPRHGLRGSRSFVFARSRTTAANG